MDMMSSPAHPTGPPPESSPTNPTGPPPQFVGNPAIMPGSAPTMPVQNRRMRNPAATHFQTSQNAPLPRPAAVPWTIGSTNGAFATMTLMQQQQQQPWNRGQSDDPNTGAAIGAAGEATNTLHALEAVQSGKSLYHDKLFNQESSSVEAILTASCDVMGFDIAEVWLRTGPKTHQLTNSRLRPTALEDSVRKDLVDVYYGEKSNERTHRLSPALCKRAKDANDVVWVTAHTPKGAEALRCSISNVRTAVAVPVCHEASNTNITIIYFSMRRILMRPTAVEFLVHMSLSAAVASVNSLAEDCMVDRKPEPAPTGLELTRKEKVPETSQSEHLPTERTAVIQPQSIEYTSITGAPLNLQWRHLKNVEYLTDGGNSWIHTAVFNGRPVVVKTLKPECQDVAVAINEIEGELVLHSRLHHPNIVNLLGAGLTSKGVRFMVLERLDGGTLTQKLGYDTRIRDRRRRFWKKKQISYVEALRAARAIAGAMKYCHEEAIPGSVVLHRDLKPDNIGYTLDGEIKVLDFGLSRMVENAESKSNEVYAMSGETGSLRYMAPEVADRLPYNHKADVYSFGIIFWELNAGKKPFSGLSRELFYERVIHGGERPSLNKKWPVALCKIISDCWDADIENRPSFAEIIERVDLLLSKEKGGGKSKKAPKEKRKSMFDRHSSWF